MPNLDQEYKHRTLVAQESIAGFTTTYVNGKPQGTVFGADMVIAQENPDVSGKFNMGFNLDGSRTQFLGSGKVEIIADESTLRVGTGTDANGLAIISATRRVRYEPGTPIFAKFTAGFQDLEDSNGDYVLSVGFAEGITDQSVLGIYQRRVSDELEYGVLIDRGGTGEDPVYYPANGTVPPNPKNLNIFRIEWGYLGVAPFNVYWRDTENEVWVRFHRQTFDSELTSVLRPDLSPGIFAQNQGNTTDVALRVGSYQAGTINGGFKFDPAARPQTYLREFTATTGTDQLIFAFRNPENATMYDSVDSTLIPTTRSFINVVESRLVEVGLNVNGNNKIVSIEVVIVPTDDLVGGTWTPVNLGYSVLDVSEDVVPVLTNARVVEIFARGVNQAEAKVIETLDLLSPGETALFIYTYPTGTSFDFNAFIKYEDLF